MRKNMSTGYDIPESQAMLLLLLLIIDLKCEKPFFTLKQLSLSLGENQRIEIRKSVKMPKHKN